MNRRLVSRILSLVAAALAVSGCGATPPMSPPLPPPLSQIDVGGYVMTDANGKPVAAIWVDKVTGTEYWAKGQLTATTPQPWKITKTQDSTCNNWRSNTACKELSAPTWYLATSTQNKGFNCARSIDPEPPAPSLSFLPPGSYDVTLDQSSAWIFVSNHVEYWAMGTLVGKAPDGVATLKSNSSYNSAISLVSYACDQGRRPTLWFTPSYVVQSSDFCKNAPSGCGT